MDKTHDQQAGPTGQIQVFQVNAAGKKNIGDQHGDGSQKLEECTVDSCNTSDEFVQENDCGIKHCGTQTEADSKNIVAALPQLCNTHYQSKTCCGHDKTEDLLSGHFLMKQERTYDGHDHRREVIA